MDSLTRINRKRFFDDAADTWDEKYSTRELMSFLEELVPKFGLKFGQKVLDVGTGTGILIPFLLRAIGPLGSIVAVDYAERMVETCRSKYSHLPNVNIEIQDVEGLNLPSEYFDAVTCFGLFPHIEDREKALYQINRVLKPEGRLVIAHALSSAEIRSHHHRASPAVIKDVLPEESEMKELLRRTGFTGIYIEDKPGCYLCISTKTNLR